MRRRSKWLRLPTEAVNPSSLNIDTRPLAEIVDVMVLDTRNVLAAVQSEKARIAKAAGILSGALQKGGRLIFIGAGTSGRLGLLEAAEMPPTFGVPRRTVQAVMAGGRSAVYRAKEGAEDDEAEGARAVGRLRPTPKDVVVGISASGITPFVRGGVARAKSAGASVVGVTCDPRSGLKKFADVLIALRVGPEIVAGSTRLKAGTATKITLNILTTSAMIRSGKTYGNLMVDVKATNAKLRDRACRIIDIATGLDHAAAQRLLERANWNVKTAIVMQKTGLSRARATARLRDSGGVVRKALFGGG